MSDSGQRFGVSVRSRLALAVTALSAAAFGAIAAIAPGIVSDALETDLLEAEAHDAKFFSEILSKPFDDSDFVREADGSVFGFDIEPAFPIDFDEAFGDGFPGDIVSAGEFKNFPILAPGKIITEWVSLARRVEAFEPVVDAAGGRFAVDMVGPSSAVVAPDGTVDVVDEPVDELGVPIFTQSEFEDYLFDDLGLFESENGALVETEPGARIATGVVVVDGIEYLVAADASSIDRSASRIRTGLWIAVPILTALVAGLAWLLASRALRPVRSITEQAATISGGSLDARVPVPSSRDEIATLAQTVNEMLDRLEADDRARRRFISDASHELRSPVAVIRNEAEVALHHPGATDVAELAASVTDESTRMSAIIDDLLALARHDEGVTAPTTEVDLDDIVLVEAARARRVPVDASAVSAGRVSGRHDEMSRLVGHLLDNAARHCDEYVAVSLTTTDRAVHLIVDDDGPGIPADRREQVFDRFARLDEARTRDSGGAGLGLAVVRGIAERSAGTVTITDNPSGGARFTVTFNR